MTTDNNLFIPILNTVSTGEAAKQSLREAIFWQIVNNTAINNSTTESTFGCMRIAAEKINNCTTAELLCDGKTADDFNFIEGGNQRQLKTLQRLYNILIQYNAWYEDEDSDDGDAIGFGWQYNNHYYRLIFFR